MPLDVSGVMHRLSQRRAIFHSEADLQHALAWQIQVEQPTAQVRLESRPERHVRLDLLVSLPDERVAIELKYLVARFEGSIQDELFDLPNQGAHDISRYDVVKDIARVERFVAGGIASRGVTIVLSNDGMYWRAGTKAVPIDAMFRLHEGQSLHGTRRWDARAGLGTMRGREAALDLVGTYTCGWRDFSEVRSSSGTPVAFRYLLFETTSGEPTASELSS